MSQDFSVFLSSTPPPIERKECGTMAIQRQEKITIGSPFPAPSASFSLSGEQNMSEQFLMRLNH